MRCSLEGIGQLYLPNISGLRKLVTLSVFGNSFLGGFPQISALPKLRTILAYDCSLTGDLPELPPSAVTVLLHGNSFSGFLDDLGKDTEHLELATALPGNYLLGPVRNRAVSLAEPTLAGKRQSQLMVNKCTDVYFAIAASLAALSLVGLVELILHSSRLHGSRRSPRPASALRYNLQKCRYMLALQALAASLCTFIYVRCETAVGPGHWLLRSTASYSRGRLMLAAYAIILLISAACIVWMGEMRGRNAFSGMRKWATTRYQQKVVAWLWFFCATQFCNLPATLNSVIDCVPLPRRLRWLNDLQKFLPAVGAVFTQLLLPHLLKRVANGANIPVAKALILRGVSTWVLPCLVIVLLSQDCYGLWWNFLPECYQKRDWDCITKPDPSSPGHTHLECHSSLRFDIPHENWRFNGTVRKPNGYYVVQDGICKQRWMKPSKCTTRVLDVVSSYLLNKFLVACLLPPALLAACIQAPDGERRWHYMFPIGVARETRDGITHVDLVLRLGCCQRKVLAISERFGPAEVTARTATWVELALGWGMVCPPIAFAGLFYICLETWAYDTMHTRLCLRCCYEAEEMLAKFPSTVMVSWLMVSNSLVAIHFGSTSNSNPPMMTGLALAAMGMSWSIGGALHIRLQSARQERVGSVLPELEGPPVTIELSSDPCGRNHADASFENALTPRQSDTPCVYINQQSSCS
eukprot:TRINITY_DN28682_c0_g1_i3.p1 TRINITY_DN28682_c0_g1~~TRINITY_DN28682_c0_g1_i3.p1  ORF type:complete len:695 (+),score=38.94 TRINITY_DN28682_c0_g1_i3:89-2173(+)